MTCLEYRSVLEADEEITEEIADQMEEHDEQCNECEELFEEMFAEVLGVDPHISTEDLLEIGQDEGWAL